jgi:predicted ATPase
MLRWRAVEAERTTLIGRDKDTEVVVALLDRTERLVTLVGAAGAGKTRLAQHIGARRRRERPEQPVLRVDLRRAHSAGDVAAEVAAVASAPLLGEAAMSAVDQIGMALADRGPVLLLLDDFDHLVDLAEATVGRWLELAPALRCLVTSRQALGIAGELRHEVLPLAPEHGLALFRSRVHAVAPSRAVGDEVARQIVLRLDCLPLAIELAAARAVVLGPEEILARLDRSLDLLHVGSAHRIGSRHNSLRAALEWSWSLLSEPERDALAALSVFEGGFSLAAATAVLGERALDQLTSLREKSLVTVADELRPELRFDLLASVRELAVEKLDERGERAAVEARHAAYFLAVGEEWSSAAIGPGAALALHHLRLEAGNLVAAGRVSLRDRPENSVRIALSLGEALALSGPTTLQLAMLDDAVAVAAGLADGAALHAAALLLRGNLRVVSGRRSEALADFAEGAARARDAGDPGLEGQVLRMLGVLRRDDGAFDAARVHLERAAELLAAAGEVAILGRAVGNLGTLHRQAGRADVARATYLRALDLHREGGDRGAEGLALAGLGHLAAALGEAAEATGYYQQALPLLRAVGDRRTDGVVTDRLAMLALEAGDPAAALPLFDDARGNLAAVGDHRLEALVIAHRAVALAALGREPEAAGGIESAGRTLERIDDARMTAALRALAACVDLARARAAAEAGDQAGADQLTGVAQRAARAAIVDEHRLSAAGGRSPFVEYLSDARRLLERSLERTRTAEPTATASVIEVGPGSSWIQLAGAKTQRLPPLLARLFDALVEERLSRPGVPIGPEALGARVWPDEQIDAKTASERVYTAIAKLRRRGLGAVVVRQSGGYLLHPAVRCVRKS